MEPEKFSDKDSPVVIGIPAGYLRLCNAYPGEKLISQFLSQPSFTH